MYKINLRQAHYIALVICIICNLAVVFFARENAREQHQSDIMAKVAEKLERLHTSFSVENVFNTSLNKHFRQISGKSNIAVGDLEQIWKNENLLAEDACRLVYFNNDIPLNVAAAEKDEWQLLMNSLNCGQVRSLRTPREVKNRLIKLLKGGVGFERLEARPGTIKKIKNGGLRTFCAWFSAPSQQKGSITGLVAFFHQAFISEKALAMALLAKFSVTARDFGYVNLLNSADSFAPDGFNANWIAGQVSSFDIKSGVDILVINGRRLLVNYKPDGRVMCCKIPDEVVPLPMWSWALAFFWFPLWLRSYLVIDANSGMSLRLLITMVFFISIALPLLATLAYWNRFIVSRTEAGKIEAAHDLEKNLVQLDASYKQIFRTSKKPFAELAAIANGRLENLQSMIDQSIRLELDLMYDTCLLIDANGNFVRPYSGASVTVRRLVFHKRAYREGVFRQLFNQGWVPFDLEAEYSLYTPEDKVDLEQFITLMPVQGKSAYSSLTSFLGKDLIALYNRGLDGNAMGQKEDVSSMVMATFMENEDENPVARIRQSLGDYVEFGFNMNQSFNFVDLIRDSSGRAVYCMILFSGQYNYSFRFLDALFKNKADWPDGVSYLALSERLFSLSFPLLDMTQRLKWLMAMMKPPRNLHVVERKINGKPHLICAYVSKNCSAYVFVATISLEKIASKLEPLKQKLLLAALIIFMALTYVWSRLYAVAIKPASQIMAGVRALETRQHDYRIKLATGDEWQHLAETFNVALEDLKELEVANFVQSCILPAGDIVSNNTVFAGRTVSADDIGGDYYDAFSLANGGLVFLMGDVSGHSVSAAIVVSMARAAFAAIVDSGIILPAEILLQMNKLMIEHLRRAKMMTCFAGLISNEGILTCSNAGQCFPFLVKADGSVEVISQIGYPLGVARKKAFAGLQMQLPEKCRLLIFSDGVIEAANATGEFFGYERLEILVRKLGCQISREEFFAGIYGAVKDFTGDTPWNDDVTLALLDYDPQ